MILSCYKCGRKKVDEDGWTIIVTERGEIKALCFPCLQRITNERQTWSEDDGGVAA